MLVEIVDRLVADEFARMNGQIEGLVAAAVERELGRLIEENLAALVADGVAADAERSATHTDAEPETDSELRTCKSCGVAKPLERFEPHRYTCKSCRSKRRASAADGQAIENPFPGVTRTALPDAGLEAS
ncbi:MAG TPA: hypothetical protein VLB89_08575 [Gaiellaceae bacterium]|nr:hypothetical protein [Gaiellaceae bacterium]